MKEQTQNQGRFVKVFLEIAIILFAVGLAWATMKGTVIRNTKDIEKHDGRITYVEKEVSDVKADIREIKTSQKFVLEGIKEIKESIKK